MIEELTERELGMVAGVARGLANQGIGSSLVILVETVKTHAMNAKDEMGAADCTQLAVMALLVYGLIDPLLGQTSWSRTWLNLFDHHSRHPASAPVA